MVRQLLWPGAVAILGLTACSRLWSDARATHRATEKSTLARLAAEERFALAVARAESLREPMESARAALVEVVPAQLGPFTGSLIADHAEMAGLGDVSIQVTTDTASSPVLSFGQARVHATGGYAEISRFLFLVERGPHLGTIKSLMVSALLDRGTLRFEATVRLHALSTQVPQGAVAAWSGLPANRITAPLAGNPGTYLIASRDPMPSSEVPSRDPLGEVAGHAVVVPHLTGLAGGPPWLAVLLDPVQGTSALLAEGESFSGWLVTSVACDSVALTRPDSSVVVRAKDGRTC